MSSTGWGVEPWGLFPWGGSNPTPPFVYGHTPTLISGVCVDEGLRSSDELVFVTGWDFRDE